jgi:hypothetical protein
MSEGYEFAPSKLLIFDTGPLWEYVVYVAVDNRRFTSLGGELPHVRNRTQFEKLYKFISSFPARTTTAHVVAEISRRIRNAKRKEEERLGLWEIVFGAFRDLGISEKLVLLSDMELEVVGRLGAVDAGLIQLARRFPNSRKMLFVEDKDFAAECFKAHLHAVVLSNFIEAEDLSGYMD